MHPAPHPIQPGFVSLRDPRTLKVVCHFNPQTREIVVIGRAGDERRTILPNVRVADESLTSHK